MSTVFVDNQILLSRCIDKTYPKAEPLVRFFFGKFSMEKPGGKKIWTKYFFKENSRHLGKAGPFLARFFSFSHFRADKNLDQKLKDVISVKNLKSGKILAKILVKIWTKLEM
mgnify:CR=1 FL=1